MAQLSSIRRMVKFIETEAARKNLSQRDLEQASAGRALGAHGIAPKTSLMIRSNHRTNRLRNIQDMVGIAHVPTTGCVLPKIVPLTTLNQPVRGSIPLRLTNHNL